MEQETEASIAMLKSEIDALRVAMAEGAKEKVGGAGADVGLPLVPIGAANAQGAFRFEDGKITNCRFMFGRTVHTLADVQDATADGLWSLVVPHDKGAPQVVRDTSERTSLTKTVIPLFRVSEGEVTDDWRGMPCIPARE